ncbi:MAG: carboxymuconolactone decarboxylase family protein [Thermoanaerobaculia bacterium]|nr:carboxymuconolactone decarboxylase family protein [Thermoanaerobaculia bacterium]
MSVGPGPIAWVDTPTDEEMAAIRPPGGPYDFGFVPNMGKLLAAHQEIGPHFGALFAQIMFADGALDRREREMVAAVAAAAQDCHY